MSTELILLYTTRIFFLKTQKNENEIFIKISTTSKVFNRPYRSFWDCLIQVMILKKFPEMISVERYTCLPTFTLHGNSKYYLTPWQLSIPRCCFQFEMDQKLDKGAFRQAFEGSCASHRNRSYRLFNSWLAKTVCSIFKNIFRIEMVELLSCWAVEQPNSTYLASRFCHIHYYCRSLLCCDF